jgi:hypothetical protein
MKYDKQYVLTPTRLAILFFILYTALVLVYLSRYDFNASAIAHVDANEVERFSNGLPEGTVLYLNGGYDGQDYYAYYQNISGNIVHLSPHWAERIFFPLTVRVLGLGDPQLMPIVAIALTIAAIVLLVYVSALYLQSERKPILGAIAIGLSPSFLSSLTFGLLEPFSTCLFTLGIISQLRKRFFIASLLYMCAIFTREDNLIRLAFVCFWILLQIPIFTSKMTRTIQAVKHSIISIASLIWWIPLFVLWQWFLYGVFGMIPFFSRVGYVDFIPFKGAIFGIIDSVMQASRYSPLGVSMIHTYLIAISSILALPLLILVISYLWKKGKNITSSVFSILLLDQIILGALMPDLVWVDSLPNILRVIVYLPVFYFLDREKMDLNYWLMFWYVIFLFFVVFTGEFLLFVPGPYKLL